MVYPTVHGKYAKMTSQLASDMMGVPGLVGVPATSALFLCFHASYYVDCVDRGVYAVGGNIADLLQRLSSTNHNFTVKYFVCKIILFFPNRSHY